MLNQPTVVVVGAGASMNFGFPSGGGMLQAAQARSELAMTAATVRHFHPAAVREFRTALRQCMSGSIDSLLETRPDLDEIGRMYISNVILAAEKVAADVSVAKNDWLGYLFQKMCEGCGSLTQFCANPVTFITYNYDRLIEHRISNALRAQFLAGDEELALYWAERPVIHLHGTLGAILPSNGHVPFGGVYDHGGGNDDDFRALVRRGANGVQVMHQADPQSEAFEHARSALRGAKCTIFLGFGFGRTNLDRLGLSNLNPSGPIICSCYGMRSAELDVSIRQPFIRTLHTQPIYCEHEWDCLEALRNNVNFFAPT